MNYSIFPFAVSFIVFYTLFLNESLAKELEVFPNGTDFQKIVTLEDRADAWATCSVMGYFLARGGNTETSSSKQREKLAEATKLIIMLTLLDDPSLLEDDHRNALSIVWAANRIVSKRSSTYIELMGQIQQEQGSDAFAKNFNHTREVCTSNSLYGAQVLKDFEEKIHSQDIRALVLAETLKEIQN